MAPVLNRALLMGEMSRKGWSQSDLARLTKLKQSTISRLLNGLAEPSTESVGKLLSATGLRYDQLFGEETKAPERLWSTREVAKRWDMEPSYVLRLVQRGELHAIRMGSSARAPLRFTEVELARFMSQQEATA